MGHMPLRPLRLLPEGTTGKLKRDLVEHRVFGAVVRSVGNDFQVDSLGHTVEPWLELIRKSRSSCNKLRWRRGR